MGLITLSCYMLKMGAGRTFMFMVAIATMTLTLNGLAVGLGQLRSHRGLGNEGLAHFGFLNSFEYPASRRRDISFS